MCLQLAKGCSEEHANLPKELIIEKMFHSKKFHLKISENFGRCRLCMKLYPFASYWQTYKLKSFKRNIFLFRLDFALQQGWGIRLSCSIQILVNATPGYTFDYHIQYLFNMFSIFSKHFTIKTRRKLLKIPFQISFSPFCFQCGRKFSIRNVSPVD